MYHHTLTLPSLLLLSFSTALTADEPTEPDESSAATEVAEHIEFFEAKIRPLLIARCFKCHSADSAALKAGLRLDSREAILKGGDTGPAVVSGKPEESLLIASIRYESYEMPPDGKLKQEEIAAFAKWIELGAPWPSESTTSKATQKTGYDWKTVQEHWSFRAVQKTTPPDTDSGIRIHNPIDQFIATGLKDHGLDQPQAATAATFVRRVFNDLIGIPPTPVEMQRWVESLQVPGQSELDDEGVAELIDALLERPQYGERWGRHWLDVARYSDGGGWTQDNRSQPNAWKYRDWVVAAFNADMPYDDFVRCQIAGDMLDQDASIGTGFFALGPSYSSDGGDPDSVAQAQSETLDDRVDTFSRAFLGLTVSCARCHDHKFDPIPTQDYYSLAGIFKNSGEGERPLVDAAIVKAYHDRQNEIKGLNDQINKTKKSATDAKRELSATEKTQLESWQEELKGLTETAPPKYPFAHTLHDSGSGDMHVALRGNLRKPGELAPRRFLRIVAGDSRAHFAEGSGRKQLAEAVVDPGNPLTSRVIVNRIWLNHFGKALVRSPSNFGTLGEQPTHPALLDWLAATLVESDWSIKSMHRLIMTSATYRSSSQYGKVGYSTDGDNRYLWRMNPRRMDVESWRDSLLAVTGELDYTPGGPSIDNIVGSNRRTMYAKVSRNNPFASDDFLRLFDFPIPRATNAKRTTNVIPQQFLFMMNSQFMVDRAKALTTRLQRDADATKTQIDRAYSLLYGRSPSDTELRAGTAFLAAESTAEAKLSRWQQYCQVLLSSNEFMYIR
jgi:hypothetical protein